MTKKINSKLLISLCLVIVLVVCAISMMACNKKKGDSSNNTTVDVITGETVIAVDNVTENKTINIPSEYTIISPSASFTKVETITTNSGYEFWIIKDGTTTTVQNSTEVLDNYFIYDLVNNEKVSQPFTTYAVASKNYTGGYTYKYVYTATVQNKQDGVYKYIGQVLDVFGNYLTTTLNGDSYTCYPGNASTYVFTDTLHFNNHVSISSEKSTDPSFGVYTTATFVSKTGISSIQMISLESFEIQPLDEDLVIPTFDTGNKYQEKTPVPGMSGYFYVIDRSKNTVFFYNSYTSSNPSSSLYFDFGDLGMSFDEDCIMGGKVVLYGQAMLPADSNDFDYYYTDNSFIPYSVKTKNAMFVFDIKTGELTQILKGYVIDKNFKLFTANNGKLYISVKLNGISEDKIPSAASKYYVVSSEGEILVSTPDLFNPDNIVVRFSNGGYAYYMTDEHNNPLHLYILDKYLNTITKADHLWDAQNNAFLVTDESMRVYAVDLAGSIKNTNLNANDFTDIDMVGDYIVGTLNDGKFISYAVGTADYRLIYDPATDTGFDMIYIHRGVYLKRQLVETTYTFTFINCNGNQIGDAITGVTSSTYTPQVLDIGLMVKIGNNYYHIA